MRVIYLLMLAGLAAAVPVPGARVTVRDSILAVEDARVAKRRVDGPRVTVRDSTLAVEDAREAKRRVDGPRVTVRDSDDDPDGTRVTGRDS